MWTENYNTAYQTNLTGNMGKSWNGVGQSKVPQAQQEQPDFGKVYDVAEEVQEEIDKNKEDNHNDNVKVLANFQHNVKIYVDVNPTARNPKFKNDSKIPNPEGQKGLTNINNTMNKAHAEIGALYQSYLNGNRRGDAVLTLSGEPICAYCKNDFLNIPNRGKRWE